MATGADGGGGGAVVGGVGVDSGAVDAGAAMLLLFLLPLQQYPWVPYVRNEDFFFLDKRRR